MVSGTGERQILRRGTFHGAQCVAQTSDSVDIEIKVLDVKEVARVDLPCGGACRIREDVEKDALVTTVVAEAATAETKVEFSFAAGGNPGDTFFIHPCSGNVFLKSSTPLDFEGAQKTTTGQVPEDPNDSTAQPGFTLKVVVKVLLILLLKLLLLVIFKDDWLKPWKI